MPYFKQSNPFVVPTTDGKLIEEHFGRASSGGGAFSVAHMVAPAHWSEPFQVPDFDEVTILIKGQKQIEADGDVILLQPGESILIQRGTRVRYSNPFDTPAEYWSLCLPAFSIESVGREA
jgi:mannose-6-phosphate isomerase-like protein (cupin superfamily)